MLEETIFVISSLTGLQEPEPGWLLPNGASIPNSGRYVGLYAVLGGRYGGAGVLPNLTNGFRPVPAGPSNYPTVGATDGAASVALGLNQITPHQHTHLNASNSVYVGNWGWMDYSDPNGDGGGDVWNATPLYTDVQGGGGAHNNMPPGIVVEGFLVAL
jgi:microcystin-dependent protein